MNKARFVQFCCGRRHGAEVCLEGVFLQNMRLEHSISMLGSKYWHCTALVPVGVSVSRLGGREGNGAHQHFSSWRSHPKIPASLAHALGYNINKSLSCIP